MRGDAKGTSERLEAIRIRLLSGFEVSVGARTIEEAKYSYALGCEYLLERDYGRATELFEEAVAMCRERGRRNGLNDALDKLGWAELARGNHERATSLYKEGLALCVELDDRWIAPESLEGLACVAAAKGESGRAARLFGAARALQEALDCHQPPEARALREPYLAAARSRLSEAPWETAFAEGKTMGLHGAIEYALSEEEPSTTALSQQKPMASSKQGRRYE